MITIKYNNKKIDDNAIMNLSLAIKNIVSETTNIKDVFVYADSPKIILDAAPIEIFIEMSASKIVDLDFLFSEVKNKLSIWKEENGFEQKINLTLIPMNWKFEVEI